MIVKTLVTLFLIVTQSISLDADNKKLTFDLLDEAKSGQEVEVRGFFYESEEGRSILAPQPNLKSCCVGSSRNIKSQITLLGNLPEIPPYRAVTVHGYFVTDPTYNEDDELIGLYYLKNIKLLSEFDDRAIYSLIVFLVVICSIVVGVAIYRSKSGV